MLQVKKIKKEYVTGDLTQLALDEDSLDFRDNEFVAILGPSGSGKTTLLNIVGGLDRYDSGDLIINGISTKKYKDRDWDSYRNHTIGFVFQSYNLIPHQSVLANVELALTISGISKSERRQKAIDALEKVGLEQHKHKRPNQLSGGQMQRVAIARALVNDPEILLADEPTGALDSETSVQVMDMLKEVAKDRLVIMVTHNPELADQYATRIVRLKDGRIISDSNPVEDDKKEEQPPEHKTMGKTSMSYFTSLALSFNNLRTKMGRTFLTAFAGSIGIIGIALIMSISTGVNNYIADIQKDAMSAYPITVDAQSVDLSSLMQSVSTTSEEDVDHEKDAVYSNGRRLEGFSDFTSSISENNLTKFKQYLDNKNSEIHKYLGENGIVYSYATKFDAYCFDPQGTLVNLDGTTLNDEIAASVGVDMASMFGGAASGSTGFSALSSTMSSKMNKNNLSQLIPGNTDSELISKAIKNKYELVSGKYPQNYNEILLVMDKNNEVSLITLYEMGMLPSEDYKKLLRKISDSEKVTIDTESWTYEDIMKKEIYLRPASDRYEKDKKGVYSKINDNEQIKNIVKDKAIRLKISGIIRPVEDSDMPLIKTSLAYTKALTQYLMDYAENSEIVKAQRADEDINILNGMKFEPKNRHEKIDDVIKYFEDEGISTKAKMMKSMLAMFSATSGSVSLNVSDTDETKLAEQFDKFLDNASDQILLKIYDTYISVGNFNDNLSAFGVAGMDAPTSISIYSDTFEDKDKISECIEEYNKKVDEQDKIVYTDYVGLLMSSVTTIVDVISYVLIAFVSVSLIVSSIMVGIITYISVMERTKEIGILRAIGASKKNISQVFNAETFIIGLFSGIIGIATTLLILLPANYIIHGLIGSNDFNAALPVTNALLLILLSVVLTLIGGLIPASKAAKQDPVKALRSE